MPVATANAVPLPGLKTYTQLLTKAGSGYPTVLVFGVSNTLWSGVGKLPMKMSFINAPRCNLLVSGDILKWTKTVGGGVGAGSAKIVTPIPRGGRCEG